VPSPRNCPGDLGLLVGVAEAPGRRTPAGPAQTRWPWGAWASGGSGRKRLLPSYDVLSRAPLFRPADQACLLGRLSVAAGAGRVIGLLSAKTSGWRRRRPPARRGHRPSGLPQRPTALLNISAPPSCTGKPALRRRLGRRGGGAAGLSWWVQPVGWQRPSGFCGRRFLMDEPAGSAAKALCRLASLALCVAARARRPVVPAAAPRATDEARSAFVATVRVALVLGGCATTPAKCGFERALLGLSGGIDSALVAVYRGGRRWAGTTWRPCLLPSPYSSEGLPRSRCHRPLALRLAASGIRSWRFASLITASMKP